MKTELEIRKALHDWIVKTNGKIRPESLTDETPIIEQRIISSLQVIDLLLFLEQLTGKSVDVEKLKPGIFESINTLYENFFRKETYVY
ncbi:MAG TPA: hypothetical protein VFA47_09845 [Candidatus Manganitrophaceae bacterium]|nr:hypothetical protein [Candidatus Manganitrophaceae bacterium]